MITFLSKHNADNVITITKYTHGSEVYGSEVVVNIMKTGGLWELFLRKKKGIKYIKY